jgi:carboxyl-terminal processing protease
VDQFQTFNSEAPVKKKAWYQHYSKAYIWLLIIVASFVFGFFLGQSNIEKQDSNQIITKTTDTLSAIFGSNSDIDTKLFKEVWDEIHSQYIDKGKIDDANLYYGSIYGMVAALDDPHTTFMDPKLAQEFANDLKGEFSGIGAEIGRKNNMIIVIAALPGTPAERAGLKSGDRILAVDGKDTGELSADQAVSLIRGDKGTKVTLSILSKGENKAKDVSITRDKISVPSVTYKQENNIAIVKITGFNDDTSDVFANIAQKVLSQNPKGLVIDLRSNPGGYLDKAVDLAGYWLEPGQVVVREEFADKSQNIEHKANGKTSLRKFKTIILVNEGSASASEILAGALKDYNIAKLVGQKTYGKGSVQKLIPLRSDSALKITVAKWLTPLGTSIEPDGITPDELVDFTLEDYNSDKDPQMDKAIELIGK